MRKSKALLGCAAVAFLANAQYAHAAEPAPTAAPDETSAAGGTASGDIVVTARRRAESILNVPIAVTVMDDKKLQNQRILNSLDIGTATPGLTATNSSSGGRDNVTFSIRGQGTQYNEPNAVLAYSDEAILGGGGALNGVAAGPIYDVDSVQVLKGPQGTLFGATSTGGAVLFTSKRASTRGFDGYLQVDGGNLGYYQVQGAANVPLSSWAAIRVSGNVLHRDGYTTWDNVPSRPKLDGQESQSFRASLHLEPAPGITNDAIYEYYHYHDDGQSMLGLYYNPAIACGVTPSQACLNNIARVQNLDPRHATQADLSQTTTFAPGSPNAGLSNSRYDHNTQTNRFVNLTNVRLGEGIMLRNIFSYANQKIYVGGAGGAGGTGGINYGGSDPIVGVPGLSYYPVLNNISLNQPRPYYLTEELQLQAQLNPYAHLTVGGYYEKDRNVVSQTLLIVGGNNLYPLAAPAGPTAYRNKAVFGQLDLEGGMIGLSKFSLSVGARQSWFDNVFDYGTPVMQTSKSKGFTYNVSLNYKPNSDVLIYLAHRKGLKPGGTNVGIYALSPSVTNFYRTFQPETVKDLELGIKAKFHGGGWSGSVEAAAYYQWYKGIQSDVTDSASDSFAGNFGDGKVKGVEFAATIRPPVPGLEFSGFFSYVDPKYSNFLVPDLEACLAISCTQAQMTFINASGDPFSHVSKTQWQIGASYELPILPSDAGVITISGTYFYQSGYPGAPYQAGLPAYQLLSPDNRLLKARLDWRGVMGSHFDAGVWADNLLDRVNASAFDTTTYQSQGVTRVAWAAPRTYGVTLRYHY